MSPERASRASMKPLYVLMALLLCGGCKSTCERALEHVAELAYDETMKSPSTPAGQEAKARGLIPSKADMMPALRKVAARRFEGRCGDAAYLRCVLAAKDSMATIRCGTSQSP